VYRPPPPYDCDDTDAAAYPGAPDVPYDDVDSDCAGDDDHDADGDGYATLASGGEDCDDTDPSIHPGILDAPYDGVDLDCDPTNDDDVDGDGHGHPDLGGDDCRDTDPNVWASCVTCTDDDGDGAWVGCDAYVTVDEDCDDTDPSVHPGALEHPGDAVDHDCDGSDFLVSDARGVFVATSGTDVAGCGPLALPCATPGFASPIAEAAGKVLFLAEGTYPGFVTAVPVYGGFDAVTWAWDADAFLTTLTSVPRNGTEIGLDLVGSLAVAEGLRIEVGPFTTDSVGLRTDDSRLVDLRHVTVQTSWHPGRCIGMDVSGLHATAWLEEVHVSGCASDTATGIRLGTFAFPLAEATVYASTVDLSDGLADTATGLLFGSATSEAVAVTVLANAHQATALYVEGTASPNESFWLEDTRVEAHTTSVHGTAGSLGAARGVEGTVLRSRLVAEGGSWGIASSTGGSGTTSHIGSLYVSSGELAIAIRHGGGDILVEQCTLLSTGTDAIGLTRAQDSDTFADVRGTLVAADLRGLDDLTSVRLANVLLDAPCAIRDASGTCQSADITDCGWSGCVLASDVQVTASLVDRATGILQPESPAIDSATVPSNATALAVDLYGVPRPVGPAWDIGASEYAP
jgi:hypothetical protein